MTLSLSMIDNDRFNRRTNYGIDLTKKIKVTLIILPRDFQTFAKVYCTIDTWTGSFITDFKAIYAIMLDAIEK